MLQRIYRQRRKKRTVNQYKGPDLDVEMQVLHELEQLKAQGNTVQLCFVREHQEMKKTKCDLDHNEQMNVKADKLTKKARSLELQTIYHRFPCIRADLAISTEYITGHYPRPSPHRISIPQHCSPGTLCRETQLDPKSNKQCMVANTQKGLKPTGHSQQH
jgi:hypothetical protein